MVSGLAFCATFFSRLRKGMKRQSLILSGFRRAFGQTPPGFQNMCIEARHLFHTPCRNPEGRRSPSFSLGSVEWPAWQDTAQRKTFIYHPPRKQVAGRGVVATRRARKKRKVYFSGGSKRPRFMYTLTCWRGARFFFRIS